jgi:hypothetical protein
MEEARRNFMNAVAANEEESRLLADKRTSDLWASLKETHRIYLAKDCELDTKEISSNEGKQSLQKQNRSSKRS